MLRTTRFKLSLCQKITARPCATSIWNVLLLIGSQPLLHVNYGRKMVLLDIKEMAVLENARSDSMQMKAARLL